MTNRALPSPEILRQLLRYETEAGKLYLLPRGAEWFNGSTPGYVESARRWWNEKFAGKEAFHNPNAKGYLTGRLLGRYFQAHRVVWAFHTGRWPIDQIDHIDGNRANNRIENLREVDNSANQKNGSIPSTNKSGIVGVHFSPTHHRWRAYISIDRKKVHLGTFPDKESAIAARRAAEAHGGYHPNHGKRRAHGK